MPAERSFSESNPPYDIAEINRKLDAGEWDIVKEQIGLSPEDAERVLRESEWIDIDIVNRLLGITKE